MTVVTWIAYGVVIGTSIWMALDARSLRYDKKDIKGMGAMDPLGWFLGGVFLWFVAFPLYITRRPMLREAGRRRALTQSAGQAYVFPPLPRPANGVFVVAMLGCLLFGLGLTFWPYVLDLMAPKLPACGSADVIRVGDGIIAGNEKAKQHDAKVDWSSATEVRMDDAAQRRLCRVRITSTLGAEEVSYAVSWQDRKERKFFVQFNPDDANR